MIIISIFHVPLSVKVIINIVYYLAAIGIVFFAFRLIKKIKSKETLRPEIKKLIISDLRCFFNPTNQNFHLVHIPMDKGYFSETFHKFISDNHPDLIAVMGVDLDDYIQSKSGGAVIYYENLVKSGMQQGFALEQSISMMKEGLLFSKYNEIHEIVQEYYPDIIDNVSKEEEVALIVCLVNVCKDVFEKYDTSDDFVHDEYLNTELIGCIALFLNR